MKHVCNASCFVPAVQAATDPTVAADRLGFLELSSHERVSSELARDLQQVMFSVPGGRRLESHIASSPSRNPGWEASKSTECSLALHRSAGLA